MFIAKKLYKILNQLFISGREHNYRNTDIGDSNTPHSIIKVDYEEMAKKIEVAEAAEENSLESKMSVAETLDDGIPSIYVDAELLKQNTTLNNITHVDRENPFIYEINGTVFREDRKENNDYYIFLIHDKHSVKESEDKKDAGENLTETQINTDNKDKPMTIQKTRRGIMINSYIILNENAWNTIVCDVNNFNDCIVCKEQLEIIEIPDHITTPKHKTSLNRFKPLPEFEMNIVRNINNIYHCAICNKTIGDVTSHLESVLHGDNFLSALNQASDVIEADDDDQIYPDEDSQNCDSATEVFEDCDQFDDESYDDNVTYCSKEIHADNDATTFEDGNQSEDDKLDGFYDPLETEGKGSHHNNSISYADIVKNPKTFTTPKEVRIKFRDRIAKVKYDCWHMILTLKDNSFYCMACKVNKPIEYKSHHCLSSDHVENLMQCDLVSDYKEHVVRKVNDRFYHCGHCNNLRMVHEMREHTENKHKKRVTKIKRETSSQPDNLSKQKVEDNSTKQSDIPIKEVVCVKMAGDANDPNSNRNFTNPVATSANANNETNIPTAETSNEFGLREEVYRVENLCASQTVENIVIEAFGFAYCVKFLSYNLIQQRGPREYFCYLCAAWGFCDIMTHILGAHHKTNMALTPFLIKTSFHLIRQTNFGHHCAICNIFFRFNPIHHTYDQMHMNLLKIAIISPTNYFTTLPVMNQHQNMTVEKSSKSQTVTDDESNQLPTVTVDNSSQLPTLTVQRSSQSPPMTVDKFNQSVTMTAEKSNKLPAMTVDKCNQSIIMTAEKSSQSQPVAVDKCNQSVTMTAEKSSQSATMTAEKSSQSPPVAVDKSNTSPTMTVDKSNQSVTMTAEKPNQSPAMTAKKPNESPTMTVDKSNKLPTMIVDKSNKSPAMTDEKSNQSPTTTVEKDDGSIEASGTTDENDDNKEATVDSDFDIEGYMYVNVKNVHTKITITAYNGLVQIGNGARYCALCSVEVCVGDLKTHVASEEHISNLEQFKFLELYKRHLIRQLASCYHCALCNVCVMKNFLSEHIAWPIHKEIEAIKKLKHLRRNDIKSGMREVACSTQKEVDDSNMENDFRVLASVEFRLRSKYEIIKKNKTVIIGGVTLKVSWDAFHGIRVKKNGYKCVMCQAEFKTYELAAHIESAKHLKKLETFRLEYSPALIRKINDSIVQCLTCDVEVNNDHQTIKRHSAKKRHNEKYDAAVSDKTDCDVTDDVLILKGKKE